MKRDMSTMRHDVESVHHVKEDIDDLRDCIDKLQEQNRRRKLRLLEQVARHFSMSMPILIRFELFLFLRIDCQHQSTLNAFEFFFAWLPTTYYFSCIKISSGMIGLTLIDLRVYREEKRVVLEPWWMLLGHFLFDLLLTFICFVRRHHRRAFSFSYGRLFWVGMHPLPINNARLHQFQFVCVCVCGCVRLFFSCVPLALPHWLWSNIPSELEKYCIGPSTARTASTGRTTGKRRRRRRVGGNYPPLFWGVLNRLVTVSCCACEPAASPTNFSAHVDFSFKPLFLITRVSTITMESNKVCVCARAVLFFPPSSVCVLDYTDCVLSDLFCWHEIAILWYLMLHTIVSSLCSKNVVSWYNFVYQLSWLVIPLNGNPLFGNRDVNLLIPSRIMWRNCSRRRAERLKNRMTI